MVYILFIGRRIGDEMPKQPKESRDTRKVMARLECDGWTGRPGKGDHVNYKKPGNPNLITIDTGEKQVKKPIYEDIKVKAGWE